MSEFATRISRDMYHGMWRFMVPWLRVPREAPTLPRGDRDSLETFQPAEGFLKYLKLWFVIVLAITDITLIIVYLAIAIGLIANGLWWVALLLFPPFAILIVVPDVIAYVAIHLRYDTTWYAMTDRAIRIRRGIWVIRETTISFENVQNVKLQQGPLQRYCDISSLIIETAGAGSTRGAGATATAVGNQGLIEGIADAERIRDLILARLRAAKGAGLGDDDEEVTVNERDPSRRRASAFTQEHVAVLRQIRDAVANAT